LGFIRTFAEEFTKVIAEVAEVLSHGGEVAELPRDELLGSEVASEVGWIVFLWVK